eukprot:4631549-Alexandrium_andersonii.AAC.1
MAVAPTESSARPTTDVVTRADPAMVRPLKLLRARPRKGCARATTCVGKRQAVLTYRSGAWPDTNLPKS